MPERSAAQEFAHLSRLTPQEAVNYLKGRGKLTQTYAWQDLMHEEHAQQFTVSRLARLDILKSFQDGITKSVGGDLSRRDWTRDATALLQKEGWWGEKEVVDPRTGDTVITKFDPPRLKLIFDTNTRMAHSAGLWERIERNKATHPYLRYITKQDERVRDAHKRWHNLTLPVDHPLWKIIWPPNGWHCRCRVMSMSQAEYNRRRAEGSIKIEAPIIETRQWINKRTGEITYVPVGIDPGFDYNVGMARARVAKLAEVGQAKLDALPAPIRKAAMRASVADGVSPAFAQAVVAAYDKLPVNVRRGLASNGLEVQVVPRLIDAAPDLMTETPPGYPSALDYRHVDGLLHTKTMRVLVAETALDAKTGQWLPNTPERGRGLLHHEVGHALDKLSEYAKIPAIKAAWEREADALRVHLGRHGEAADDEIEYLTRTYPDSAKEVMAELFALRHESRTTSVIDAGKAFPDTMQLLYQELDEGKL